MALGTQLRALRSISLKAAIYGEMLLTVKLAVAINFELGKLNPIRFLTAKKCFHFFWVVFILQIFVY